MLKLPVLLFFSLLPFTNSFCQVEKIDTDRPDQTESAVLVPKKWFQFEFGIGKQVNSPGSHEFQHPTLLSKYGISKRIELRLITTATTNSYFDDQHIKQHETGLEPVEVGAKVSLWEEKKMLPKASLIFHFAIPKFASKKFRVEKPAPNFRFTFQNSITENIAIGYNLGAEWDGFNKEAAWLYTFAPGFTIGKKWYAYVEAFGFMSKLNPPEHSLDGGIAYYVTPDLKLDLSSGFGVSPAAPDWYVAFGWSVRFKAGR